jgi:molybdopterin-guanine dinucleotide biosynthesis protein A
MSEHAHDVFLMCGGQQTRMGVDAPPKQLTSIGGVPLVLRTLTMLQNMLHAACTIIAPNTALWQLQAAAAGVGIEEPQEPLFLAEVQRLLKQSHADRVTFLCGDTVFSRNVLMHSIGPAPVTFFTRHTPNIYTGRASVGELYGFSINTSGSTLRQVLNVLQAGFAAADDIANHVDVVERDQLRERNFRPWLFMHLLEYEGLAHVQDVAWNDYTDDIDSPEDLQTLPNIEAAIAAEGKMYAAWDDLKTR